MDWAERFDRSLILGKRCQPHQSPITMRLRLLLTITASSLALTTPAEDWPQFRGPGGRAISETAKPPISFGHTSNVVWKVAIPFGHSSPVVTGQQIFFTAEKAG